MPETSVRPAASASTWVLPVAALIALGAAMFDYFWAGNGIHGTGGVLLVIASSAVMLIFAVLLVRWARGSFAHGLLLVLLIIDIAGTALAAYFLHAWWILGAMVLAAIGWLIDIRALHPPCSRRRDRRIDRRVHVDACIERAGW